MKWIGIVGSRRRNTFNDKHAVEHAFWKIYDYGDRIVSGGCPRGADAFAEKIAKDNGIPILLFYPDWSKGRWAGFARNTEIAKQADMLIACVADDRKGGTEDTVTKYKKTGKDKLILV